MWAMRLVLAVSMVATTTAAAADEVGQTRMSPNAEFLAKHYPPEALKRGEQGKVGFKLVVEPDGSLGSCEITQKSGFASLDSATCEIIVNYAQLKKVQNADGRSVRAVQVGYIDWKLPKGSPQLATSSPKKDTRDPERIICKRQQRTGSLIATTKVCHTAREWAELSRRNNEAVEQMLRGGAVEDGKQCAATMSNPAGC